MSAIREVKYLRELHHPNVIEVSYLANTSKEGAKRKLTAPRRFLIQNEPQSCSGVS